MSSSESAAATSQAYHERAEAVLAALGTDPQRGLSAQEAQTRLARHGPNELATTPPVPAWRRFLAQFTDILVVLLLIATAVSAAVWWYERDTALPYEAIAIFAIVCLNAVMGFVQEARAEKAVSALLAMAAADASVLRDGERRRVPAKALVPGDIILIEEGDTIPADARLLHATALQTSEAALTGESLPVSKDAAPIAEEVSPGDQLNMVFSGTAASYGRARAVVVATGMQTEVGRIAGMLEQTADAPTPLQVELDHTGRRLGVLVLAIAVVMVGTILFVQDVTGLPEVLDVLILGVALAVAAVPEGLPAIVTAVLSLGVQRMARRNAIVRHLAAVETLGSASVIASDKTGTLTKNEMTARLLVTASGRVRFEGTGYAPSGAVRPEAGDGLDGALEIEIDRALTAGERANNAVLQDHGGRWEVQGDPTEGALIVAARKAGLTPQAMEERYPRVGEVPFSSERKLMTTVHRDVARPDRLIAFAKGAPDVLLGLCSQELVGETPRPLTSARRRAILEANEALASEALRPLGLAFRPLPGDALDDGAADTRLEREFSFLGLIGLIDPPREEARQAVARARSAGIRPVMITGDHPKTAAVIAAELGILTGDGASLTGADLERMPDEELARRARDAAVYARVNPAHKMRIVKALQQNGAVVAMTGDGVNDAPALKGADIGVAMGITGTDVSKEAADMILVDDNFASIVAAVEEGRSIFANIRKFLRYLLSSNVGEVLTMFGGVVLADAIGARVESETLVLPLLATQILWINLVTDGPPALALGLDPPDANLMNLPPRPRRERVVTARMWRGIFFVGAVMAAGTLLVFDASMTGGLIEGTGNLRYGQTMAFTTLMLFQMFNVVNARSDERSAFEGLFTNRWLWIAVAASIAMQVAVVYVPLLQEAFNTVPLTVVDWGKCAVAASSVLWVREIGKFVARERAEITE